MDSSQTVEFIPPAFDTPFSTGVRVGDVLYLSGQIGMLPDGTLADGFEAQARQTMENIVASLIAYGSGVEAIFKCTVMLDDMSRWQEFNKVYLEYFPASRLRPAVRSEQTDWRWVRTWKSNAWPTPRGSDCSRALTVPIHTFSQAQQCASACSAGFADVRDPAVDVGAEVLHAIPILFLRRSTGGIVQQGAQAIVVVARIRGLVVDHQPGEVLASMRAHHLGLSWMDGKPFVSGDLLDRPEEGATSTTSIPENARSSAYRV